LVNQLLASLFGRTFDNDSALLDNIAATLVVFLAYPLCILREFHSIKVRDLLSIISYSSSESPYAGATS
jgi:hypothetical protein